MTAVNPAPRYWAVTDKPHQTKLHPHENKFHKGNGGDGKHYWLTPPKLYEQLHAEFQFDFDPCPYPLPEGFDGLTCEWGASSYVNPPFGSIMHDGKKKGPTAWVRKAITEHQKDKQVVLVYPVDKWVLMLLQAGAQVRNLGDVKWLATEDGSEGKGTGRHIACFVLANTPTVTIPASTLARLLAIEAAARNALENSWHIDTPHPDCVCHDWRGCTVLDDKDAQELKEALTPAAPGDKGE